MSGEAAPGLGEPGEHVVHLSVHVERSELAVLVLQAEASGASVGDVLRRSLKIGAQVMLAEAQGGRGVIEHEGARALIDTSMPPALPGPSVRS